MGYAARTIESATAARFDAELVADEAEVCESVCDMRELLEHKGG